jgi:hypothetical protein
MTAPLQAGPLDSLLADPMGQLLVGLVVLAVVVLVGRFVLAVAWKLIVVAAVVVAAVSAVGVVGLV